MTFKIGDRVRFKKGIKHSYGANDKGGQTGTILYPARTDPDIDWEVQFSSCSQTCLASELELVSTSKFKVGDKVMFEGWVRTIKEKCNIQPESYPDCWLLESGQHSLNESGLTLLLIPPAEENTKKYYKVVAIVNGKFVSFIAGRGGAKQYFSAQDKPTLTYALGQKTEAPGNGVYLFTTMAGAQKHVELYRKDDEYAILEGIISEELTNPFWDGTCDHHPALAARVFLPERVVERSCPIEPEEVWEDVTRECTFELSGFKISILVKYNCTSLFRFVPEGVILSTGFFNGNYALASTDNEGMDSYAGMDGFAILHKVA